MGNSLEYDEGRRRLLKTFAWGVPSICLGTLAASSLYQAAQELGSKINRQKVIEGDFSPGLPVEERGQMIHETTWRMFREFSGLEALTSPPSLKVLPMPEFRQKQEQINIEAGFPPGQITTEMVNSTPIITPLTKSGEIFVNAGSPFWRPEVNRPANIRVNSLNLAFLLFTEYISSLAPFQRLEEEEKYQFTGDLLPDYTINTHFGLAVLGVKESTGQRFLSQGFQAGAATMLARDWAWLIGLRAPILEQSKYINQTADFLKQILNKLKIEGKELIPWISSKAGNFPDFLLFLGELNPRLTADEERKKWATKIWLLVTMLWYGGIEYDEASKRFDNLFIDEPESPQFPGPLLAQENVGTSSHVVGYNRLRMGKG